MTNISIDDVLYCFEHTRDDRLDEKFERNSSKLPTQIDFLSVFGILLNIFEIRILPLQGFFLELQFSGNLYFWQLWKIDLRAPAPGISLMRFVDSGYPSPCFFFECCSNSKLTRFFFTWTLLKEASGRASVCWYPGLQAKDRSVKPFGDFYCARAPETCAEGKRQKRICIFHEEVTR